MGAQLGDRRGEVGLVGVAVEGGRDVALDAAQKLVGIRVGAGEAAQVEQREGRDARAQVGAGGLAGVVLRGGEVDHVVDQLEGDADLLAEVGDGLKVLLRRVGEQHADLGRGGDERSGLVGEHLEVVVDRILVVTRTDRLVQLAEAEPLEGLGLQLEGLEAERRPDLARAGEEQVAREDRDRVAPDVLGTRHAPAHLRLVHDVVVIQRGEVRDLDGLSGEDHLGRVALSELSGEQGKRGPHALAAGIEEVAAGGIRHLVGEAHLAEQAVFDGRQALLEGVDETALVARREELLTEPERRGQGAAATRQRDARIRHLKSILCRKRQGFVGSDAGEPTMRMGRVALPLRLATEASTVASTGLRPRWRATTPAVRLR